jgi:arylsulfatase A-like enzyme
MKQQQTPVDTRRREWLPLAAASVALLVTGFWAAPATVFLFNAGEVTTSLPTIITWSWPVQAGLIAVVALLGAIGRASGRRLLAAVLLALAALLYLQGNVLVRSYGKFDGSDIDWSRHAGSGALEAAAWLGVLVAAVAFRRRVWKYAPGLAAVIVLLNGLTLGSHLLSGRTFAHATTSGLDEGFAGFSRDRNVLIVVMDAFASPVFEQMLADDPAWQDRLDGFTWYRDALAVYPTTLPSIPAILSGRTTDNARPVKAFLRESLARDSLPVVLQQQGFAATVITEPIYGEYFEGVPFAGTVSFLDGVPQNRHRRDALLIWNVALFRYVPHHLKMRIYADHRWLLRDGAPAATAASGTSTPYSSAETYRAPSPNQMAGRILQERLLDTATATSRRPTFKFVHFFTTHMPWFVDADCTQLTQERYAQLTEPQAVVAQSTCALNQFLALVERLEELDVLDNTLVILTGDHGSHLELIPGAHEAALAAGRPSPTRVLPLLLVKPIGATGTLKVSEAPVSLTDIAATVAKAMDVAAAFPGRPLGEVPEGEPRSRTCYDYTWLHDYWWEEYLPAMTEYKVEGAVRDPAAWSAGRALPTGPAAAASADSSAGR